MVPRLYQLGIPLMFTKRIFVTSSAINHICTHTIIVLPLSMIYFIVADSKYDVCTQQLCIRFWMECAVLLDYLFLEATAICGISFIWIWEFKTGVRKIEGLTHSPYIFKIIKMILALLKDILGVSWWYFVTRFLVNICNKAILTHVCPILLNCIWVEAPHIVVKLRFLNSGIIKGVRQ